MFANTFQSGFISIFYSVGSSPLSLWDKQVKNGHIRRVIDDEVKSLVLEVAGTNVATTYITCPIKPRASLAIRLPFLVMIVKNMKKYFTFEIQILDDKDMHRRFRVSNFQSTTKVRPFCTTMPIGLSSGWNQIQFNLADFTRRAYGTMYLETMRVQVHANVRIRRIYFADRLYSEEEMPSEYRLFIPLSSHKGAKGKELDTRPSKEQTTDGVASKPSRESAKKVGSEPAAAPPSPVGTEAVLAEQSDLLVGYDTDQIPMGEILSEGMISEEMRTESAPSESEVSQTSEVPPSDVSPSEEAGTEEAKGEEKQPAEGGGEPTSEGGTEEAPESPVEGDAPAEVSTEAPAEGEVSADAEAPAEPSAEAPGATETPAEAPAEASSEAPAEASAEAPTETAAEGE